MKSIRHFYPETTIVLLMAKDSLPLPTFDDAHLRVVPNPGFSTVGCLQYLYTEGPDEAAFILHDSMTVVKPIVYDTGARIQLLYSFHQPGMGDHYYSKAFADLLDRTQHIEMVTQYHTGCFGVSMYIRRDAIEPLHILPILPRVTSKYHHEAMERVFGYLAHKYKLLSPKLICREYLHSHFDGVPWKAHMTFEEMLALAPEIPILKVMVQRH